MYISFMVLCAICVISCFNSLITEDTVISIYIGYIFEILWYSFFAYFAYYGNKLQAKRDLIQRSDETIYRPDSYVYRLLSLYFVFTMITNVYFKIIEFIYLKDTRASAVVEIIGYVIVYGVICIILSEEASKTQQYDPVSKKFTPESYSSTVCNIIPSKFIPLYSTIWNNKSKEENIIKMVENPAGDSTAFCVRAGDDSMKPSGILRGSLVYFSETAQLNKGDIVASLIGNQIVIRRAAYAEDGAFALEASNDAFPAMVFETQHQAHILGVATAIFIDMGK